MSGERPGAPAGQRDGCVAAAADLPLSRTIASDPSPVVRHTNDTAQDATASRLGADGHLRCDRASVWAAVPIRLAPRGAVSGGRPLACSRSRGNHQFGSLSSGGAPTSERRIGRAVLDAVSGVPLFVTAPLIRRWHTRWGATKAEAAGPMPGDEIVPKASFNATRAITIDAPPERVWPWIVQMGYRRAGFYTYALLDNAGYESADRILPEYQDPKAGDWMPMSRKVNQTTAFKVKAFEPNRWLIWEKPDSTWSWKLVPLDGDRTRLITRLKQRYAWESPASAISALVLLEFGDFAMIRRVLNGIRARAENRPG